MEWQRRSRLRVPLHYPVQLHSDDNMGAGILMNLSSTGCQVRSTLPLETGTYVAVDIRVPHHPQPVAIELSIVRWEHDGRYGLEFVKYAQGGRERLLRLTTPTVAALPERETDEHGGEPPAPAESPSLLAAVGE